MSRLTNKTWFLAWISVFMWLLKQYKKSWGFLTFQGVLVDLVGHAQVLPFLVAGGALIKGRNHDEVLL